MIKEVLYRLARTPHLPLVLGAAAIIWISGCAVQTDDGVLSGPILTGTGEVTAEKASLDLPRTLAIMPL